MLNYDPYDNEIFDCYFASYGYIRINPLTQDTSYDARHGTIVASLVAGETTEQGGTSNGQLSSIGFNTKMIGYKALAGNYLQRAYHASKVMKANIITSSAGGWSSCPDLTGIEEAVVKEILDNGTTIIMPAGNGQNETHNFCASIDPNNHTAFFPLSPYYDSRVIIVSSTNDEDKHQTFNPDNQEITHSHYPMVDICSPEHGIMGATFTDCGNRPWPYYGSSGGTSFATPIVAGTAALIYSINQCLMPQDIEYILKNTTDPISDAANYPGMVGTGRINAYKAVLMATTYGKVTPITANTSWAGDKFINDTLIIEQGATLTITGTVRFSADSKVIIKQGGKLIIDGGTLTNEYNSYWQGIEVWGTSTKNQYPQGSPTYQGILIVRNGGTIENAHAGATNWKSNDYDAIGGVIQATDAIFRNNRVDVGFATYQNFAPSKSYIKVGNHSFFRNTEFFSDNDYIEGFPQRDAHVTMWDVDGISFMNCHFANNVTTDKDNSTAPMRGIYSINAGYKVEAGCDYPFLPVGQPCPSEDLLKSSFSGFNMAMEASGASTSYTVRVEQSEFSDNLWNILIEEMDNVSINRNEIEVADAGYTLTGSNTGAGIVIDASTGYIVEENTLTTNFSNPVDFGIFISNSGEDDNRVYKNSINGYEYGNLATGVNHNTGYSKGLQFLCNNFEENGKAIYIGFTTQNDDGIRYNQGDFVSLYYPLYITSSAGNTFINNTMDIENYTSAIRYFYKGANAEPINNSGPITVEEATFAHTCLTSFGGSVGMKSSGNGLDSLASALENYTLAYNNLNYTLHTLIDDGNTEELKEYIENYWSSDAWTLRGNLLE
ncbi:MAG: S8 family serine peptidase [Brumimicrobium sp.]|nr:S8 family serine peptidase [Brumimicrobium sp.]